MINVDLVPKLYSYMSTIFSYGLSHQYSFEVIQDRISFSDMFRKLEQADDSFLKERTIKQELELIYSNEVKEEDYLSTSSLLIWLGEAYLRLFFKFHKSIYYLFLYIPLEKMIGLYDLYHEMDWNQLFDYYIEQVSQTTLLRKLLDKKSISINKLSLLTGISESTIKYYCLNDKNIYEARYTYIDAIAVALKVNSNVFLKEIHNYLDYGRYLFDKEDRKYRSYLGYYISSFFCANIKNRKFKYNSSENIFESHDSYLKVLWTKPKPFADISNCENRNIGILIDEYSKTINLLMASKTILVVFEFDHISMSVEPYLSYAKLGFERIIIINQSNVLSIGNSSWIKYITDDANKMMIEKAKRSAIDE